MSVYVTKVVDKVNFPAKKTSKKWESVILASGIKRRLK